MTCRSRIGAHRAGAAGRRLRGAGRAAPSAASGLGAGSRRGASRREVGASAASSSGCRSRPAPASLLYLAADREPVLWLPRLLAVALAGALALAAPPARRAFALADRAPPALVGGFVAAELRSAAVARAGARPHPHRQADRLHRGDRPAAARARASCCASTSADGLDAAHRPVRVRLTTRRAPTVEAGRLRRASRRGCCRPRGPRCRAATTSRATPISPGSAPSARVLGRVAAAPAPPRRRHGWLAARMAIDRARNALARAGRRDRAAATPARSRPPW